MKKIIGCLLLCTILLTACSLNDSSKTVESTKEDKNITQSSNSSNVIDDVKKNEDGKETSNGDIQEPVNNSGDNKEVIDNTVHEDEDNTVNKSQQDISEKVRDYIINGQEGKSEAEKLKWSPAFLSQLDIDSLYEQYKAEGGNIDDIQKIAEYITLNAPVPDNWQELFENDLYEAYGQKVVRLELIDGVLYQAYVNIDGKEVPYVAVSARTGYFHG